VIGAWLACAAAAILGLSARGVEISAEVESLLPPRHRALADEPLVLLGLRAGAPAEQASSDTLLGAAAAIADRLGSERVPLAPPAGEAAAWFDAHALFLVPDEAVADLRARMTDEALSAAVEDLRARLSSPLFGVGADEPRRDPLGLRAAAVGPTGGLGLADALGKAQATASGDLIDRTGTAVLVQLRSTRSPDALLADVVAAIGDAPVDAALVGPAGIEASSRAVVASRWVRVIAIGAAALAIVLALGLRSVRATAAILACLATALAVALAAWQHDLDAWSVPLLVLLLGFACEGALPLPRISALGWPAPAVLATALAPLAIAEYPAWQRMAWSWGLGVLVATVLLRVVVPAIHARIHGEASWEGRGAPWRPMPVVAVLLSGALLGAGAWASTQTLYRGADRVALAPTDAAQTRLVEEFFDPALVVRANANAADAGAALELAARQARSLATLVPASAVRIDSPGSLVVRADEIDARRAALVDLQLTQRMMKLREILESRGFRADAFGEFLRTARADDAGPTATAMLEGPLGPWLRRFEQPAEGGTTSFRSFVHLGPDRDADLLRVDDDEGRPIPLVGPAAAARRDRSEFQRWFGIWALCQMWLGAFVVWVGARSFAIAMSSAFATLVTQCATLVAMVMLRLPLGPHVLPGILLVGAAATIAAARACRAVDRRQPLFAGGLLVASACQAAAALALVASDVPTWRELGLVVAIGAATASGVGLFVAPGLCRALRRFFRGEPEPAGDGGEDA
jgi:hypothetical protein